MIFILVPLVPLYRPSVFRVGFFSIFQFIGDTNYTLPCHDFKVNIQEEKNNFIDGKE